MPRSDEPYMQPYPPDERFDVDVGYRDFPEERGEPLRRGRYIGPYGREDEFCSHDMIEDFCEQCGRRRSVTCVACGDGAQ